MTARDYISRVDFEFPDMQPDERLRELILYICEKSMANPTFGAVLLNKILYYADFTAYARRGQPITGSSYRKLQQGPVPARFVQVRNEMIAQGDLEIEHRLFYNQTQERPTAKRAFQPDLFTDEELGIVDEVITMFWGARAADVSDWSHDRVWRIARMKQAIPYQAVWVSSEPLSEYDIRRSHELVHEHGWKV